MPDDADWDRDSESGPGLPARADGGVGGRDSEGPEGRGLREEAGMALRRRHRRAPVLPAREPRRAGAQTDSSRAVPFVRGSGKAWEIDQDADCRPGRDPRRPGARSGRPRGPGTGIALAAGVERLAQLCEDRPVDVAAREIEFVFAVGSKLLFRDRQTARGAACSGRRPWRRSRPTDLESCRMHCTCARRG